MAPTITSSVFRASQLGVQSSFGTPVTATKKLLALGFEAKVQGGAGRVFRPAGQKFPSLVLPAGDELSTIAITGEACYDNLTYLLSPLLGYAAPVQQGATTAYKWTMSPNNTSGDTLKYYTLKQGPSGKCTRVADVLVNGATLKFTRKGIEVSGTALGKAIEDGQTLDAIGTTIDFTAILPSDVDVYMADSYAGLSGASALEDVSLVEWHLTGKYGTWWNLNSATASFAGLTELAPDAGGAVKFLYGATGIAERAKMRAGTKRWVQVKAISSVEAGTAYPYSLTLTFPAYWTTPGDAEDEEGAYVLGMNYSLVYDQGETIATDVELVNKLTGL